LRGFFEFREPVLQVLKAWILYVWPPESQSYRSIRNVGLLGSPNHYVSLEGLMLNDLLQIHDNAVEGPDERNNCLIRACKRLRG
jgi:hypothetical protein